MSNSLKVEPKRVRLVFMQFIGEVLSGITCKESQGNKRGEGQALCRNMLDTSEDQLQLLGPQGLQVEAAWMVQG